MTQDLLFASQAVTFAASYTLAKNVPAIPILSGIGEERSRLGLMTQLPEGAEIHWGGPGFDENTIKVQSGGASYFVFVEDLEPRRKQAAWAAAS